MTTRWAFFAFVMPLLAGCLHEARLTPEWRLTEGARPIRVACANVDAWIAKSGAQGIAVTIEIRAQSPQPCTIDLRGARFEIANELAAPRHSITPPPPLRSGQIVYVYVPFPFDNRASWNSGKYQGTVVLDFGQNSEIRIPADHVEIQHSRSCP